MDKYGSERSGGPVELHLLRESGVPSSNEETLKENELQQENYLLESSSILLEGNHIPSKERDYILFFDPKTNVFNRDDFGGCMIAVACLGIHAGEMC